MNQTVKIENFFGMFLRNNWFCKCSRPIKLPDKLQPNANHFTKTFTEYVLLKIYEYGTDFKDTDWNIDQEEYISWAVKKQRFSCS